MKVLQGVDELRDFKGAVGTRVSITGPALSHLAQSTMQEQAAFHGGTLTGRDTGEERAALASSLKENGQSYAVLIHYGPQGWRITDGNRRARIMADPGFPPCVCEIRPAGEDKLLSARLSATSAKFAAFAQAMAIRQAQKEDPALTDAAIAHRMGKNPETYRPRVAVLRRCAEVWEREISGGMFASAARQFEVGALAPDTFLEVADGKEARVTSPTKAGKKKAVQKAAKVLGKGARGGKEKVGVKLVSDLFGSMGAVSCAAAILKALEAVPKKGFAAEVLTALGVIAKQAKT